MSFFAQIDSDLWLVLPSLSLGRAECECCREKRGLVVSLGWACVTVGVAFGLEHE